MIMNTIQDIQKAFDDLKSEDGTLQFIAQRTLLPRERVERIYRLGSPWPIWENEPELEYFSAIQEGKSIVEGDSIASALNALALIRGMDIENIEVKLEDLRAARERGEHPEPLPELEGPEEVMAHLKEVTLLSGEKFDVVQEVFLAEIARLKRMLHMIKEVAILKASG